MTQELLKIYALSNLAASWHPTRLSASRYTSGAGLPRGTYFALTTYMHTHRTSTLPRQHDNHSSHCRTCNPLGPCQAKRRQPLWTLSLKNAHAAHSQPPLPQPILCVALFSELYMTPASPHFVSLTTSTPFSDSSPAGSPSSLHLHLPWTLSLAAALTAPPHAHQVRVQQLPQP